MTVSTTDTDRGFLRRALELAEMGRGRVSPNPLVGAVIVRDGQVIGEGFHAALGDLHAERAALADCEGRGADPAGATMYVSLEPCAHQGRQPPCTEAILEAGIARVVICSEDPSEKAAGRGPGILRDGGVDVAFADGEEATAARMLNQPFRKHARTGLPLVVLKLAMSLDGRTETAPGDPPWISGEPARSLVHRWRAESDAIAAGIGTVLADDPLLTARPSASDVSYEPMRDINHSGSPVRQPLRVIFDSAARLPLGSRLVGTAAEAPVIVFASEGADPTRAAALRDAGVDVTTVGGATPADRLHAALSDLGRREITSLFLEGGRTLAAAFAAADQIDEARIFIAPILLAPTAQEPDQPQTAGGDVSGPAGGDVSGSAGENVARAGGAVGRPMSEEALATAGHGGSPAATGPARRTALMTEVETVGDDVLIVSRFKEW